MRMRLLVALLALAACVSIPPEASTLSAELGKRIGALESAHINMLRKWMDERKTRVDDFMSQQWIPTFSKELMEQPAVQAGLRKVQERPELAAEFFSGLGTRIQTRLNEKRNEYLRPLEELERRIERHLRDEYALAKSINNAVTSFLVSAGEVAENRDRYLGMIGVKNDLDRALDKADDAVSGLVSFKGDTEAALEKFMEFKDQVDAILAGGEE